MDKFIGNSLGFSEQEDQQLESIYKGSIDISDKINQSQSIIQSVPSTTRVKTSQASKLLQSLEIINNQTENVKSSKTKHNLISYVYKIPQFARTTTIQNPVELYKEQNKKKESKTVVSSFSLVKNQKNQKVDQRDKNGDTEDLSDFGRFDVVEGMSKKQIKSLKKEKLKRVVVIMKELWRKEVDSILNEKPNVIVQNQSSVDVSVFKRESIGIIDSKDIEKIKSVLDDVEKLGKNDIERYKKKKAKLKKKKMLEEKLKKEQEEKQRLMDIENEEDIFDDIGDDYVLDVGGKSIEEIKNEENDDKKVEDNNDYAPQYPPDMGDMYSGLKDIEDNDENYGGTMKTVEELEREYKRQEEIEKQKKKMLNAIEKQKELERIRRIQEEEERKKGVKPIGYSAVFGGGSDRWKQKSKLDDVDRSEYDIDLNILNDKEEIDINRYKNNLPIPPEEEKEEQKDSKPKTSNEKGDEKGSGKDNKKEKIKKEKKKKDKSGNQWEKIKKRLYDDKGGYIERDPKRKKT